MTRLSNDYLIRPARMHDAEPLLALVAQSAGGLSSLQPRLDFLTDYIAVSIDSFAKILPPDAPHKYLLTLHDLQHDKLIGCAAVKTNIGTKQPFVNFDIAGDGDEQVLRASHRFTGCTEVGSLFLDLAYRDSGLGGYLARSRYLLIAAEPWRFGETIIAELRGDCGAHGSPLYDYLFADKLEKSFLQADAEYFDRNPDTIGDIVPLQDIAVSNLPLDVVASLGQPHRSGLAAMRLLQSEGFLFSGTIDLFDGGPIMAARCGAIRTIMNSQELSLSASPSAACGPIGLVATGGVSDFRAVLTSIDIQKDQVFLRPDALHALQSPLGTQVRTWINISRPIQKTSIAAIRATA